MPLTPAPPAPTSGDVGYLVDLANQYVGTKGISAADLQRGGYAIYTTFNKQNMAQLKSAVNSTMDPVLNPAKHMETDPTVPAFATKKYPVDAWLHVGGASVVPGTGAITAIYGGPDYMKQQFDDANDTGAQVGSTFKAYVLAAALSDGLQSGSANSTAPPGTPISSKSLFNGNNDVLIKNPDGSIWTDPDGNSWKQLNDSGESLGYIDLNKAMAQSINSVYVQLGMDVGMPKVKQAAITAGLNAADTASWANDQVPSFALGTSTPSAIRMAGGYATFAAQGVEADPYSVDHVVHEGVTTSEKSLPKPGAFSADVANTVTAALKGVVSSSGTGAKALALGRDAAGKTGTTDDKKSAWFVGYTPQLSTAIGLFDEDPTTHTMLSLNGLGGAAQIYGADYPTKIWTAYMTAALQGKPKVKLPPAPPNFGTVYDEEGAPKPSATPTAPPTSAPPTSAPPTSATPTPSFSHQRPDKPTDQPTMSDSPTAPPTCGFPGILCESPTDSPTLPTLPTISQSPSRPSHGTNPGNGG